MSGRGRRLVAALLLGLTFALVAFPLLARPGGGQTYSGSSSSSSSSSSGSSRSGSSSGWSSSGSGSSGSSGGGDLGGLIVLLFENPPLGVAVIFLIGAYVFFVRNREGSGQARDWTSAEPRRWDAGAEKLRERMEEAGAQLEQSRIKGKRQSEMRAAIEGISEHDPNFSVVLFEDFVVALFAEAHVHRGRGTLAELGPWISGDAHQALAELGTRQEVSGIVVGAMRYVAIEGLRDGDSIRVQVEIESNYSEGAEQRWYSVDRWLLARKKGVRSKPKDKTRVFECPSCGAPLEALRGRECSYCKKTVAGGDFDWEVREIRNVTRQARPPGLGGHAPEMGTELPTVVDPAAKGRWEALCRRDPAVTWPAFLARLDLTFKRLQESWNGQDLALARPFVSDGVYQSFAYWIDAYQRQRLRNYTEGARILSVQMARVTGDAVYDSVTVRVFATGYDFTLDGEGTVVGGSRDQERRYSEYWTLIRGAGQRGAPRTDPSCPSCGAPLEIAMTGHCKHCRVKVTSGDFDWVLSRIEQDESY